MKLPTNYADASMARNIAQNLYLDAKNISMVEHSHDNIVALIDNNYAVRFPRDKNSYLRSLYERHILKQLESVETLEIPRILNEHFEPPYVITTFVPGHHISSATVRGLSKDLQSEFSKRVASFAYTMHTSFSLDEEQSRRKELGLDELPDNEPWPVYFKKVIHDTMFPSKIQDTLAKQCYSNWVRICNIAPSVVVHDDLHTENMMFKNNRLVGVLDFGDTNVGTPEQELRQLYRISEEVMLEGVETYQHLSGRRLNVEAIKLWAIMKELADYSKASINKNTSHHSFIRSSRNLNNWLPEGEWGKGYDISSSKGYQ